MLWIDILIVIALAILFTAILAGAFGWRHPASPGTGPALLFLFLVFVFAMWAGGLWFTPVGPVLWGAYWVPFVLIGLPVALILLAAAPMSRPPEKARSAEGEPEVSTTGKVFGAFFWILFLVLLIGIVVGYRV